MLEIGISEVHIHGSYVFSNGQFERFGGLGICFHGQRVLICGSDTDGNHFNGLVLSLSDILHIGKESFEILQIVILFILL